MATLNQNGGHSKARILCILYQEFKNVNQNTQNRLLTNPKHVPLYPTITTYPHHSKSLPLIKKKMALKNYKSKLYLHILMI